jgi:hypothetical protein
MSGVGFGEDLLGTGTRDGRGRGCLRDVAR